MRFKGYFESIYLHPKYFRSEPDVIRPEEIRPYSDYAIIRFVSWKANHDMYGQNKGLSAEDKIVLVENLSRRMKIYISSEVPLPAQLEIYRLKHSPEKIHTILKNAALFIGESLTMASEAALLGTPSLCISTAGAGTLEDQKQRGLVIHLNSLEDLIKKSEEILSVPDYKMKFKEISEKYFAESVNVTDFLTWFIEKYPSSRKELVINPNFQFNFK